MTNEIVSIIIPVYNAEKYLDKCLNTIVNQTYRNLQIIIINDGSTDNSINIIEKYSENDDRIELTSIANSGLSVARNTGLKKIKGEYITFIDADDYISFQYIQLLLATLISEKSDIVQCAFIKGFNLDYNFIDNEKYKIRNYVKSNCFVDRNLKISVWAKLYKKCIWDNILFPVGKLNEDEYVTYQAFYMADKISYVDVELYYYLQNPTSIMHKKRNYLDFVVAFNERIDFYKERNEQRLLDISEKELCIRLALFAIKEETSKTEYFAIKKLFMEHFENCTYINKYLFKEKILLYTFKYFNYLIFVYKRMGTINE